MAKQRAASWTTRILQQSATHQIYEFVYRYSTMHTVFQVITFENKKFYQKGVEGFRERRRFTIGTGVSYLWGWENFGDSVVGWLLLVTLVKDLRSIISREGCWNPPIARHVISLSSILANIYTALMDSIEGEGKLTRTCR